RFISAANVAERLKPNLTGSRSTRIRFHDKITPVEHVIFTKRKGGTANCGLSTGRRLSSGGVSKRSALITALLLAIAGCTIEVVLQGEGDYLLGVLVAIGVWSLVGLVLMMRWTISLQFWGAIGNWLRGIWR